MTSTLSALVDRATSLLDRPGRALLGVTGAPGAGKSTLTETLLSHLSAAMGADAVGHLPMDGFHLADVQLDRLGRRTRKGAPDTFDVDGYVAALRRLQYEPDRTLFAPASSATSRSPSPPPSRSRRRRGSWSPRATTSSCPTADGSAYARC
nr:hypothetical protein [uncultured Nocardioides sp.]